jgi:hypothetical protein
MRPTFRQDRAEYEAYPSWFAVTGAQPALRATPEPEDAAAPGMALCGRAGALHHPVWIHDTYPPFIAHCAAAAAWDYRMRPMPGVLTLRIKMRIGLAGEAHQSVKSTR